MFLYNEILWNEETEVIRLTSITIVSYNKNSWDLRNI